VAEREDEKKRYEDRYFYEALRKEQRDLVWKELQKEKTEVERRVIEEEKKKEEAIEELKTFETKRRIKKWLIVILIIILVLILVYYLNQKGYLNF